MYKVANHKMTGMHYRPAHNIGPVIKPTIIVLHDTASRLTPKNAANYLASNNPGKVSVHFVVERDGDAEQQVPMNRKANHAGASHYNGRKFCNGFSIGIEIVNPGRMAAGPTPGTAVAWYDQVFSMEAHGIREVRTDEHGSGFWMPYTEEQLKTVDQIVASIIQSGKYPIEDIVPHWYISPGRKVDTNPLFPLSSLKSRMLGRDVIEPVSGMPPASVPHIMAKIVVATGLNMRRWPSFNPNVIQAIPFGSVVPILDKGTFDHEGVPFDWLKVNYGSQDGWIVDNKNYVTIV